MYKREQTSLDPAVGKGPGNDLPLPGNKRFYPALDGLRAIAVLMVFWQHYVNRPHALQWGWAGVDVFFVLSGFLITGILYDTRNDDHRLRNFYIRRTLRIFPLYYGLYAGLIVTIPVFHWVWGKAWYLWPLYLGNYGRFLYLDTYYADKSTFDLLYASFPAVPGFSLNFSHFWSLCVEEQFYLIWPFAVFVIRDRVRLRNVCAAVVVLTLVARVVCVFLLPHRLLEADFLYRFTPLRGDALLLGGFVALCLRGPEAAVLERYAGRTLLALVVTFAAIAAGFLVFTHHGPPNGTQSRWISSVGFSLIDLFSATIILILLDPSKFLTKALSARWLRQLGQISYGFYFFHQLLHHAYLRLVIFAVGNNPKYLNLQTAALAFVCTLLLSYGSFRMYESPILRWKNRLTRGACKTSSPRATRQPA